MPKDRIKIKKLQATIILAAIIVLVLGAFALGQGLFGEEKTLEKPKPPAVSIGCDRVVWEGTELEITASTQNIKAPQFNWTSDGKYAGSGQKLINKFDMGEHRIMLTVTFDNKTLTANQTTIGIDSTQGVSVRDSSATNNQWGFQTQYNSKNSGVKGLTVSVDSSMPSEVNECGHLASKALMAGDHTWNATFQGNSIGSGKFNIKEVSEVKITSLNIAKSYTAGSTVNAKIVIVNTGSTIVTGFEIRTLAVNNNYAFMGDKAKKEYVDQYKTDLKPGVSYDIPIGFTIPEKVSGIRPSGKYTITVSLVLNGQVVDKKIVNTEVK
ncbi:MAG: hypothetical protein Q7J35_17290 [Candidatus Methanoperedens sp.]|nr:hypothetical protein [Candidatus Methanoperedens sp.]